MRLVTVRSSNGPLGGVVCADGSIISLERWGMRSVEDLIEAGPDSWTKVEKESEVSGGDWAPGTDLCSPVGKPPRNMMCIGLNYVSHHEEGSRTSAIPEYPVVFTKPWTTIVGPDHTLSLDKAVSEKVDWEAELAVVIGRGGIDIPRDRAMDHVFGYMLANDLSARDVQLANGASSQWHKGKSLDGFCPLGPILVTPRTLTDLGELQITLTVNGETKQDFWVRDMYHSVPRLIEYLSQGMALLPGDLILTGTAAGVGLWRDPPEFLGPGDVVEVSCEGLGVLRTHFIAS